MVKYESGNYHDKNWSETIGTYGGMVMQYISRSKIPDGVKYIFQDVDTGEIREIEQFY